MSESNVFLDAIKRLDRAAEFARIDPEALEMDLLVDVDHMRIRGILDRMEEVVEVGPDGVERTALVITDYKTGKAPGERYANKAFFALKIYALLIRISMGVTPTRIRLLYLNGPTEYTMEINDGQLDAMAKQLAALWGAIEKAITTDTWPAKTSTAPGSASSSAASTTIRLSASSI